ncbi:MAG TPA: response regulator transcription factor [Candidatus Limnocylindrales bacterium]
MTIRVLIADDQALIRTGLRGIIESAPDLEVVGEAVTGREAVDLTRAARADVVLMDIRMPELDGLQATELITADDDLAGVRVLILTTFELDEYVLRALRAGASGFLGKGATPAELVDGIRAVANGDSLLSARATQALISRFLASGAGGDAGPRQDTAGLDVLTDREREILVLVAHGLSNEAIGERLYLSPLTAKTHVNRAMTKLGVRDRAQLVVIAYQSGLVRPGSPTP